MLPRNLVLLGCITLFVAETRSDTIDTIIVTAQSRQQAASEVPIAIHVVTDKKIAELGAVNLSSINGYIPGLNISGAQVTQPIYALRGVSSDDLGIGTDAPVGIYIDGVYTGKTGGALMNFNDIQRVEIIKGPQGTLFGRNSAAGAIAIYTNEPMQDSSITGRVRAGQFNTRYVEGAANSAISNDAAVRFAFANNRSDGWVTNRFNGNNANGENAFGTRLSLKWSPDDAFVGVFSWEHEDLDQAARPAFGVVRVPNGTRPPTPPIATSFVNPFDTPLLNDAPSDERRKFDGATLRIEMPIANVSLSSITAFRHFTSFLQEDNDGSANPVTYIDTINRETNTSWQQEFRLAQRTEVFDWVTGVSWFHARANQQSEVNTNTDTLDTFSFGIDGTTPFSANGLSGAAWSEQVDNAANTSSSALYGDVIWHATRDTNVTGGVRVTHDVKSVSWQVPAPTAPALGVLVPLIGNQIFQSAATLAGARVTDSQSWNDISPRVVIDQHLSANNMIFASIARGYQAGGYDTFVPGGRFAPERMTNYEIGNKNSFPELGITLNESLFHYRFHDLQDISWAASSAGIPTFVVGNSDQSATGFDLDGAYYANANTTLFAAAEYISQRYDKKFVTSNFRKDPDGSPLILDLKNQPVGTPLLTLTAGLDINWELPEGLVDFTLQGAHTSADRCNDQIREEFGCLDSGAVRTGKAVTRVDMKLGWENTAHHFGFGVLVNNIFNKRYLVAQPNGGSALAGQTAFTLGTPYATLTPPRFCALELTVNL
ncbi:MAG TPA: TonB-dependent receptor [Spongiibacteraceae bacterium]|jgi:iron complex outermembrane receptor protein